MALPLAIGVLATLSLLAAGLFFAALQSAAVADARTAELRARLAAESAASAALAGWSSRLVADLPIGARRELPAASGSLPDGTSYSASVERLAGGLFLVRGEGEAPGRARGRVGALVRAFDVDAAAAAFHAAVATTGSVELASTATVNGAVAGEPPPPWAAADCAEWPGTPKIGLLARDAGAIHTTMEAVVRGSPEIAIDPALATGDLVPLASLTWEDLAAIADRTATGDVQLAPRLEDGVCDEGAAENWGAPLAPSHACSDYFPLVFAPADLRISAGAGQGILVVQGDLALDAEASFYGPVLVAGRLELGAGARIEGAAHATGVDGTVIAGSASFRACAVGRALRLAPALNRPFPVERPWIPLF